MKLSYPFSLKKYEDGLIGVFGIDVPEAITAANNIQNAICNAEDALVVALKLYAENERDIPSPSQPLSGQIMIHVPPLAAMKLALYQAMRLQGVTKQELSKKTGFDMKYLGGILDITKDSKANHVQAALSALSLRVVLDVQPVVFPDMAFSC